MDYQDNLFDVLNIILFNRPQYAKKTLISIKEALENDNCKCQVSIWIDGYKNSKDEFLGKKNNFDKVLDISKSIFPYANFNTYSTNQGIAKIYYNAEKYSIKNSKAIFSLFFEEDYIISRNYFSALKLLMFWAKDISKVAIVSAHGLISHSLNNIYDSNQIKRRNILYPMHELWAYAVKNNHLKERDIFVSTYLSIINKNFYWQRDSVKIRSFLKKNGINHIHGSSQDWVKKAALYKFKKLALTVPRIMGENIGKLGQHSNVNFFQKYYQNSLIEKFDKDFYLSTLKENIDFRYLDYISFIENSYMQFQYENNKKYPLDNKLFKFLLIIFRILNDNYQFLKKNFLKFKNFFHR